MAVKSPVVPELQCRSYRTCNDSVLDLWLVGNAEQLGGCLRRRAGPCVAVIQMQSGREVECCPVGLWLVEVQKKTELQTLKCLETRDVAVKAVALSD